MPHEVIRRVFAWMAALGLGVSWVAAVAVQSPGPFKSGTELVLLPVSARDAAGRVVRDLVAADFRIFENGRPQQISHFSGRHLPVALSLLLDTSSSMQGPLEAAQVAAIALLDQMGPEDVAQLVAFNTTVDIRQDFSRDRQLLRRAISGTQAGGATALHNAVYIALRGLQKLRPTTSELRREAIVVLSAGQDTASAVTADQVVDAALRSQTLIYAIGLRSHEMSRLSSRRESFFTLRRLAEHSGGLAFTVHDVRELDARYKEIYDTISASYMLGYVPSQPSSSLWSNVSVAVTRTGVSARTRADYFRR